MKNMMTALTLLAAACGSDHKKPMPDAPAPAASTAIVAAGDFQAGHPGTLAALDVTDMTMTPNAAPAGSVGDDPNVRHFGGELFIVNRADGNNVTILDAATRTLVAQLATGAGSDPYDVAVKGQKLYVATFQGKGLAVLTRGSNTIATIDLSADDPDGEPNCVSDYLVGNNLYVACELLDPSYVPRGMGKIYVVDTTTDTVAGSITMATKYPQPGFAALPSGDLVIPTADFSLMNGMTPPGCIEKVTTGTTPASTCLVTNDQLAGIAGRLDIDLKTNTLWMATASADFSHLALRSYDLASSTLAAAISPANEMIVDLAVCPDGSIVVSDEAMNASGLRVYANGAEVTTAAMAVGLDTKSQNALVCY